MTTFATDTFTDTPGVSITSHAADLGGTWAATSWNNATIPTIQSNKLRFQAEQFVRKAFYLPATPASADYSAFATLTIPSDDNARCYPGVRMSTSAQTGYFGGYQAAGKVNVYKWVSGTITEIGAAMSCAMSAGDTLYCEVEAIGTTIKAYFQRGSDSKWLASANTFQTTRVAAYTITGETSIGTTGKAGLWGETLGTVAFDIDDFGAFDTSAPSGFTAGATLGAVLASGSLQSVMSGFGTGATLGAVVAGGSLGPTPGTFLLGPILVNGVAAAGAAIDWVRIYSDAGVLLYERTGGTLNGAGSTTLTTNTAPPGTVVRIDWQLSTGKRRMPRVTMG